MISYTQHFFDGVPKNKRAYSYPHKLELEIDYDEFGERHGWFKHNFCHIGYYHGMIYYKRRNKESVYDHVIPR
jgi:hypothetical protein